MSVLPCFSVADRGFSWVFHGFLKRRIIGKNEFFPMLFIADRCFSFVFRCFPEKKDHRKEGVFSHAFQQPIAVFRGCFIVFLKRRILGKNEEGLLE